MQPHCHRPGSGCLLEEQHPQLCDPLSSVHEAQVAARSNAGRGSKRPAPRDRRRHGDPAACEPPPAAPPWPRSRRQLPALPPCPPGAPQGPPARSSPAVPGASPAEDARPRPGKCRAPSPPRLPAALTSIPLVPAAGGTRAGASAPPAVPGASRTDRGCGGSFPSLPSRRGSPGAARCCGHRAEPPREGPAPPPGAPHPLRAPRAAAAPPPCPLLPAVPGRTGAARGGGGGRRVRPRFAAGSGGEGGRERAGVLPAASARGRGRGAWPRAPGRVRSPGGPRARTPGAPVPGWGRCGHHRERVPGGVRVPRLRLCPGTRGHSAGGAAGGVRGSAPPVPRCPATLRAAQQGEGSRGGLCCPQPWGLAGAGGAQPGANGAEPTAGPAWGGVGLSPPSST